MVTAEEIKAAAMKYIGAKWKHQGRLATHMDCIGLLILVGKDLGVIPKVFDFKNYSRYSRNDDLIHKFNDYFHPQMIDSINDGDILILKVGKNPQHVAIYLGDGIYIHSCAAKRKVLLSRLDSNTISNIRATYNFNKGKVWEEDYLVQ